MTITGARNPETAAQETKRLRAELGALKRELAEARDFQGQSGVINDDFINRTSLGHLRNKTWAAFTATVRGLGQSRLEMGFEACRAEAVSDLTGDLYTLGLTPPKSAPEAIRRRDAARMLESKAFFAVLSHPGTEWCHRCGTRWENVAVRVLGSDQCTDVRGHMQGHAGYDGVRVRYIGEVAECFYRPGVWALFVRSPETIMMPGFTAQTGSDDDDTGD